jgi:hypothetical protein
MITKVVHGWRPGGLIAYLLGPGRAEEHRQPRVIASWDGRDAAWQPARTGPGEWDLELGPLIRAMRAPAVAAGLPEVADEPGKRGYVWHCSARVAANDRQLSDRDWAGVARELLDGSGIAVKGDGGGPRWVAIRHADDHIHIAAVLVRQDTGRRFWPHHDFPRLREAAHRIERRMGLTLTAAADGTAARAPGRGEIEKARRTGRKEPARIELARVVREAAVLADNAESFIAALREAGYLAELRRAPSGDPLGYTVGRPDDLTAAGVQVRYSGSKLAADLSMPRLLRRWAEGQDESVPRRGSALPAARRRLERAARTVRTAADRGEDVGSIVHATGDVLTALRSWPGAGDDLDRAADLFDRAARSPRGQVASRGSSTAGSSTAGLRQAARQLIRQRRLSTEGDLSGVVALAVALTALVREVAAWQRARGRVHQAAAATAAAEVVGRWAAASPPDQVGGGTSAAAVTARSEPVDHVASDERPRPRPSRRSSSTQQ